MCLYFDMHRLYYTTYNIINISVVYGKVLGNSRLCAFADPEVEFVTGSFSGELTENPAVPVCLFYTNTDGG